ncbi:hypothetical protein DMA11_16685 [Marinilabiliaceae bacterium JC017]|nr:hypothetical protein DMA11_16685 [Marinilabiliaceae bacterium JC017]
MPGMNGTGPQGQGPRTGRGQGRCKARQTQDDASNPMNDNMSEQYGQGGRGMNRNQSGGGRMRGNQNGGRGMCRRRNNA